MMAKICCQSSFGVSIPNKSNNFEEYILQRRQREKEKKQANKKEQTNKQRNKETKQET